VESHEAPRTLAERVSALDRENRLLRSGVKQLTRIRQNWARSVDELKLVKGRLEASNRFLDRLLQSAPLPVVVLDRWRGRIVMANGAAENLVGVARGGLTGCVALTLLDRDARRSALRRTGESGSAAMPELRLVTLRRETRVVEMHWTQLQNKAGGNDGVVVMLQDITERRCAEERLHLAGKIIETSPQGVVVLNPHRIIATTNEACRHVTGWSGEALVGQPMEKLLGPEQADLLAVVWREVARSSLWQGEALFCRADGTSYSVLMVIRALADSGGRVSHYILLFIDITDRKRAEDQLRFLSLHDPLTGLGNRVLFRDRLEHALARAVRDSTRVGVLYMDLDGFKHINDAYGHDIGDKLLTEVAARLKSSVRTTDTVVRFGGDEFASILADVHCVSDVETVARKVLDTVAQPYLLSEEQCKVTVSIGIGVFPDDTRDMDELMKFADIAMYRAKAASKDAYRFFTKEMNAEALHRLSLAAGMQRALERNEFVVYYQPQTRLATRQVDGFEALARWDHPTQGLIATGQFIDLAEETGFISALGEFVLRTACRQCADWRDRRHRQLRVAVKLSVRQFRDPDLVANIADILQESGLPASALVLEITESTVMQNVPAAQRVLRALRALGVAVALDEFGTGYASMAYLRQLPVTEIKIDRQFIHDLENDHQNYAITDAIIRMGAALGLAVVAEGLETQGQLEALDALQCDRAQGRILGPPLPAAAWELAILSAGCPPSQRPTAAMASSEESMLRLPRTATQIRSALTAPDAAIGTQALQPSGEKPAWENLPGC